MENNDYNSEADVETKYIYRKLLKEVLNIPEELISFHVPVEINQGREKIQKEADILIKSSKGENLIVIESKSPVEDLENYIAQVDSYAFHLEAPLSILSNYKRMIIRIYLQGNKKEVILDETIEKLEKNKYKKFQEIIENIEKNLKKIEKKDSNKDNDNENYLNRDKITNYRSLFRKIHTQIRSLDKLDPTNSFDEFSKVLFIKIINDKINDKDKLTIEKINVFGTDKEKKEYIDRWFKEKIQEYYADIFPSNERILLSPLALEKTLKILNENFNLEDRLKEDIKGRAFEEFLPSQLRGKGLGQFFTPRTIVDFMINLAEIEIKDKILDFSSGSGGFLIKAFDYKKQIIESMNKEFFDYTGKSRETLLKEIKTQIYGIDAEYRAVRTAKMNMLLWGDGKQIQHGNGLDTKDYKNNEYLALEYDKNNPNSGVDIILANPPFGSKEEDEKILKNYELSKNKKNKKTKETVKTPEKTEHLFIEKAYKMLKPNGKLLIILPEGIFSNNDSRIRDFLIQNFKITDIIKLPKHTFVMSGVDTINTVILKAVKNNIEREEQIKKSDKKTWISSKDPMNINFSLVNQLGYEPSGKVIKNGYETSDLKILENKIKKQDYNKILSNPYEYSEMEYGNRLKNGNWNRSLVKFLQVKFNKVPKRLDPTYYFFKEETKNIMNNYTKLNLTENNLCKIKLKEEELNSDYEKSYNFVSVVKTLKGDISEIKEYDVGDILSQKEKINLQKLSKNDIVFNPYRINTGSIIYIDSNLESLITSGAYIVIRDLEDINPKYLVQLLKTPFMKYQIQVLASGSVRDNFSKESLKKLKIPNISLDEQSKIVDSIDKLVKKIKDYNDEVYKNIENINKLFK